MAKRCGPSLLLVLALVPASWVGGCASQECDFLSECGRGRYCAFGGCRQDCRLDTDCASDQACSVIGQCGPRPDGAIERLDAALPPGMDAGPLPDAGLEPPPDAGPPGLDSGSTPDAGAPALDAGPPSPDAGPPPLPDAGPPSGTGTYLDRCLVDGDCATHRCVDDIGGTRMCTIPCSTHRDCASEHVCAGGVCVRDDTGSLCSLSMPAHCALGLCYGNTVRGTGHCTRECVNAVDCPSGYACVEGAPGLFVCANIEVSCTGPTDCGTGICIPGVGCTSSCRSAADCPGRFYYLSPYTCGPLAGAIGNVCIPPSDIIGADPIGTPCSGTGSDTCRSGSIFTCDSTPLGLRCTQACDEEGGCGDGLGCFPSVEDLGGGLEVIRLCSQAGTRALGQPCSTGRDCDSGVCDGDLRFCTRLCTDDGLCPSDMTCRAVPGFGVAACRR